MYRGPQHQRDPVTTNSGLAELISKILNKNAFIFEEQHYLQVHGTAMGTRMAPSYANLFMAQLERKLLDNASMKPLIWWRYTSTTSLPSGAMVSRTWRFS